MSQSQEQNPFFIPFNPPHNTFPFDKIKPEHYKPAFMEAMKLEDVEIDAIVNNKEKPSFENTIEAMEFSGKKLGEVSAVFFNLLSANTSEELENISLELSPILTEHGNNISLNEKLFARIKEVYLQKEQLHLNPEQQMLLQNAYDGFVRNGANLNEEQKEKYRELTKELSTLTLQFGQNVLKETNQFQLVVTDSIQLKGLPEDLMEALAGMAKEKGKEGWLLNITAPIYIPVMKYAENRDLRKQLYEAANTKAVKGNDFDNQDNIRKITSLRLQLAQLLGYSTYADYVLVKRMAENQTNVNHLLDQLLEAYKPTALKEYKEVQAYAEKQGFHSQVMPWDWAFYSEKLKKEKFEIDDQLLKPYLELEKVKKGVFGLATQLYGLEFKKNTQIPVYNSEVEAYEVFEKNTGKFIAVLYVDFHPRDSKQSGAWMTEYRGQYKENGVDYRPHISLVMNFTRATESKPALLTYDELTTFLHEFGHALHGMLSDVTYESLSGTNVYRDFVELPSQIMENWASEKEFLDEFAIHYQTGEKIPMKYINKLKDAENFNVAYACLRQLSFAYLDMAWHTITVPYQGEIIPFETKAWEKTQVLPKVDGMCMSTAFNHIFSGGYAAGYYSYKWAEVLDADAYSVFQKNGIFDPKTAASFRDNILSKGGSEHPMILYKRFRGQEPTVDALLQRNGIKTYQHK